APVGHLVPIGPSPLANRGEVGPFGSSTGGRAASSAPAAAATCVPGPGCQCVAQLSRILLAEVDLVGDPVDCEGDGFVRLTAVDIVDEDDFHSLSHVSPSGVVKVIDCRECCAFAARANLHAITNAAEWEGPFG